MDSSNHIIMDYSIHDAIEAGFNEIIFIREGTCTVRALPTSDTWYGMTYQEDVAAVKEAFTELLKAGVYKEDLFSDL